MLVQFTNDTSREDLEEEDMTSYSPPAYSSTGGPSHGHNYSGSTVKLLSSEDDIVHEQSREAEPSETVYDPVYKPGPYEAQDYAYDPANYASDAPVDKPFVPYADAAPGAGKSAAYQDLEYADPFIIPPQPLKKPNLFQRYFGLYPLEQRIADKKAGIGVQRRPYIAWAFALVMLGVLIYELVVNDKQQGSPVSFHPIVNYMLGPSESALIYLGARYPACMKNVTEIPLTTDFACMNDTANPITEICPLSDLCGFGGIQNDDPNQWFRFITPIFLHAGIVHYLLNMTAQLTVSAQVEREMGSIVFLILYIASGIFGNVLGGNFALVGVPSVGASGAIFGTTAIAWIDLFAHWRYQYKPRTKLAWMSVELLLGFALGYIPYVDNFAHLGGLLMGLLVGMMLYPIISPTMMHRGIVIGCRLAAIVLVIVLYVVLIHNFYKSDPYAACEWCRYLSCIPTSSNDYCKGINHDIYVGVRPGQLLGL